MAIALLGSTKITQAQNGGTSGAVDTTGASLLVIVSSQYKDGGPYTPSDSKSNTWSALTASVGATECYSRIFYVANPTVGTGHTFTLSGGNAFASTFIGWFSGVATSTPFDQQTTGNELDNPTHVGPLTPTQDNELIIAGLSINPPATGPFTADSSFTVLQSDNGTAATAEGGSMSYLVQTSAGAVTVALGWDSGGTDPVTTMASFKAAAAGGTLLKVNQIAVASVSKVALTAYASVKAVNGLTTGN